MKRKHLIVISHLFLFMLVKSAPVEEENQAPPPVEEANQVPPSEVPGTNQSENSPVDTSDMKDRDINPENDGGGGQDKSGSVPVVLDGTETQSSAGEQSDPAPQPNPPKVGVSKSSTAPQASSEQSSELSDTQRDIGKTLTEGLQMAKEPSAKQSADAKSKVPEDKTLQSNAPEDKKPQPNEPQEKVPTPVLSSELMQPTPAQGVAAETSSHVKLQTEEVVLKDSSQSPGNVMQPSTDNDQDEKKSKDPQPVNNNSSGENDKVDEKPTGDTGKENSVGGSADSDKTVPPPDTELRPPSSTSSQSAEVNASEHKSSDKTEGTVEVQPEPNSQPQTGDSVAALQENNEEDKPEQENILEGSEDIQIETDVDEGQQPSQSGNSGPTDADNVSAGDTHEDEPAQAGGNKVVSPVGAAVEPPEIQQSAFSSTSNAPSALSFSDDEDDMQKPPYPDDEEGTGDENLQRDDDGYDADTVQGNQVENEEPSKTVNEQPENNSLMTGTNDEDSHFFAYFLTFMVTAIISYLVFHNKQRIIALIIEGRAPGNGRGSRRGSSRAKYHKLDNNLEEAITATKGAKWCYQWKLRPQ